MGFDLYGEKPKINKDIENYPVYSKYVDMEFNKKQKIFKKDEAIQSMYYKEMDDIEGDNPGRYFRNNCWWWRPLWHFVCNECDDILTEEDAERGGYNDNHLIGKRKALAIADRLDSISKSGELDKYMVGFETERAKVKLNNKGKKMGDDSYDWSESYPFDAGNVREFAKFCRQSGGFRIG